MANVIINDTNLTNIANAIREKNGTTDTYKPSEMATAITNLPSGGGGGYEPTDEELEYSSHASSNPVRHYNSYFPFADGANYWILQQYGDRCSFNLYTLTNNFFARFSHKCFDANIPYYYNFALQYLFSSSTYLEEITGSLLCDNHPNKHSSRMAGMFYGCNRLRTIGDNFLPDGFLFVSSKSSQYGEYGYMFRDCYSLRELPKFYNTSLVYGANSKDIKLAGTSYFYNYTFANCYALNKIKDLRVVLSNTDDTTLTSNGFNNTFTKCHNLHKLTFDTNADGTPKVAAWNKQTIDLSQYVGYSSADTNMTGYNSGLTADGKLSQPGPGEDIQVVYTDDTINDYWAAHEDVAKYGHDEAVETINSLPDTSAAGGGNTIKFKGSQGYRTNYMKGKTPERAYDSKISTLTEAEIAVATAKGWTVSLT